MIVACIVAIIGKRERTIGATTLDININMMLILSVKTISMVDLRTQSEGIVRALKRGERMLLSYRGQPLAELVPAMLAAKKISPLEALQRAQDEAREDSAYFAKAAAHIQDLHGDRKAWSERSPS
jgi:antitoxin (DNA-binding transcriptional repressor) of toxin-antitoxin stability system